MRNLFLSFGGPQPHWMQHNLPWLAVLAMVLGLVREDAGDVAASDTDG